MFWNKAKNKSNFDDGVVKKAETILNIDYSIPFKSNKGHLTLDLVEFFPASAKDTRTLLTMVQTSEAAGILYNFLKVAIEITQYERKSYGRNETKEKAQATAAIKRYIACMAEICDTWPEYELMSDTEVCKVKACKNVYADILDRKAGQRIVKNYTGWKFEKYGITFTAYKERNKKYPVLVPSLGLAAGYAESKQQITTIITEELAGKIKSIMLDDIRSENSKAREFSQMIVDAGFYVDDLHKPITPVPVPSPAPEQPSPAPVSVPEALDVQSQPEETIATTETTTEGKMPVSMPVLRYVFRIYTDWTVYAGRISEQIITAANDTEAQKKAIELSGGRAFTCNRLWEPEIDTKTAQIDGLDDTMVQNTTTTTKTAQRAVYKATALYNGLTECREYISRPENINIILDSMRGHLRDKARGKPDSIKGIKKYTKTHYIDSS